MTVGAAGRREAARHRVTWADGVAAFHCDGDRESECHWYPSCDDEWWPCGHEFEPHDECWRVNYLRVDPINSWWDGGEVMATMPKVDGEIETEWDDGLFWCYADSDELAAALRAELSS